MKHEKRPRVIGHRGCAGLAPENTLAACQKAIELGVDGIELDVHLTQDNQVIVHHDMKLNPDVTKNRTGQWISFENDLYIRDLTLAEVQQYYVGEIRNGSEYAHLYPHRISYAWERIPSLQEIFCWIQQQDREIELFLELKTSPFSEDRFSDPEQLVPSVLKEVKKFGMQERVCILSFDFRSLFLVKAQMPEIKTHYLTDPHWTLDTLWLKELKSSPFLECSLQKSIRLWQGCTWSPYFKDQNSSYITLVQVEEARAENLQLMVWTPNEKKDLQAMIDLGVDGIITDYPDILLDLLKDSKKPVAPEGNENQ